MLLLKYFCVLKRSLRQIWQAYKAIQATFWTAEEVLNVSEDVKQWKDTLHPDEHHSVATILTCMAYPEMAGTVITDETIMRICAALQIPEGRCFYGYLIMM